MLFPPTSEADPAYWAAVAAGHVFVGIVLMALVSLITGRQTLSTYGVSAGYLIFWETFWQQLGAGVGDAIVDSLFVTAGALIALFCYKREWPKVALVMSASISGIFKGISNRHDKF